MPTEIYGRFCNATDSGSPSYVSKELINHTRQSHCCSFTGSLCPWCKLAPVFIAVIAVKAALHCAVNEASLFF